MDSFTILNTSQSDLCIISGILRIVTHGDSGLEVFLYVMLDHFVDHPQGFNTLLHEMLESLVQVTLFYELRLRVLSQRIHPHILKQLFN